MEEWWGSFDVQGTPSMRWWQKMKQLKANLKQWNKEVFGLTDAKINDLDYELNILEEKEEGADLDTSDLQ
ncbi:hypothetical protein FRX31_009357, partial [Thalictrum thalictroides]